MEGLKTEEHLSVWVRGHGGLTLGSRQGGGCGRFRLHFKVKVTGSADGWRRGEQRRGQDASKASGLRTRWGPKALQLWSKIVGLRNILLF